MLPIPIFFIVYLCLAIILRLILSSAVFTDAKGMHSITGRGPFLVGPRVWWLIILLGGMIAVVVYWMIHYSTLRPPPILAK